MLFLPFRRPLQDRQCLVVAPFRSDRYQGAARSKRPVVVLSLMLRDHHPDQGAEDAAPRRAPAGAKASRCLRAWAH